MSVYKGMALFGGGTDTPDAGYMQPFANLGAFLPNDIVQFSINQYHLGVFFLIMNCVSWAVYLTYQVQHLPLLMEPWARFLIYTGPAMLTGTMLSDDYFFCF